MIDIYKYTFQEKEVEVEATTIPFLPSDSEERRVGFVECKKASETWHHHKCVQCKVFRSRILHLASRTRPQPQQLFLLFPLSSFFFMTYGQQFDGK